MILEAAEQVSGSAFCVYIVDDDADVRNSIGFMLAASGRRTETFASGSAFLDAVDGLAPGCILLDVRMPGIDGLQVLAELEKRRLRWPVVMMTGHGEVTTAVQALKLGAVDFIEKPFEESLLQACLGRAATLLP